MLYDSPSVGDEIDWVGELQAFSLVSRMYSNTYYVYANLIIDENLCESHRNLPSFDCFETCAEASTILIHCTLHRLHVVYGLMGGWLWIPVLEIIIKPRTYI